jgi:hypothetical protein
MSIVVSFVSDRIAMEKSRLFEAMPLHGLYIVFGVEPGVVISVLVGN